MRWEKAVYVSRPWLRVAQGCTSLGKTRSPGWKAGNSKRGRWKGRSGAGASVDKPRGEGGHDSGDGHILAEGATPRNRYIASFS